MGKDRMRDTRKQNKIGRKLDKRTVKPNRLMVQKGKVEVVNVLKMLYLERAES